MSPVKFQLATVLDNEKNRRWTDPSGITGVIDTSVTRLRKHRGGGFTIRLLGEHEEAGVIRDLDEIPARIRARGRNMDVGDVLGLRAVSDGFRLVIRKVHTAAAKMDTAGNDRIDRIHTALWHEFGNSIVSWGINVCRHIDWDPSKAWSQHAYANAEDVHGSVAVMDKVAHWLLRERNAHNLPIGEEILWRGHNLITGNPVYDHYDHVHYSGAPLMTGTPACA